MNTHASLRMSTQASPFAKSSTPRSPTKPRQQTEEPGLRLSKVIGSTTASVNAFDCLPHARKFAYTAGAAAVVATVADDLQVSQRFFRAKPTSSSGASAREGLGQWPLTPTPADARTRTLGHVKEHSIGGSPLASARDWSDSPSGRTTTAKTRVKAATSVALSPNGKWLAVGETGYKPRIVIFSLAEDAGETPVAVLAEHTFGVHSLSFSPDSRYLASLGTVNDGFLYIWNIDERSGHATLHASNKCTVLVNAMAWMGTALVTVGLRFVKVWRPDDEAGLEPRRNDSAFSPWSPRHRADNRSSDFGNSVSSTRLKVLAGKNSLLGDLLDANFVAVLAISDVEAITCSEAGDVCILNDADKGQTVTAVAIADFPTYAARLDQGRLYIYGLDEESQSFDLETLRSSISPLSSKSESRRLTPLTRRPPADETRIIAIANIGTTVISLDSNNGIRLVNYNPSSSSQPISHQLAAHDSAVMGVRLLAHSEMPTLAFFTFCGNGTIHLWNHHGASLSRLDTPVEASSDPYAPVNELKAATPLANGSVIATGDRCGTLVLLHTLSSAVLAQARAHSAEIVDVCAFVRGGTHFVVTASRDRMVQLFTWQSQTSRLELLQTMDEHAGAVIGLLATDSGDLLLSCSADRTVVVREAVQRDETDPRSTLFIVLRTITLKASPTSMCLAPLASSSAEIEVLIATTDRCVSRHSLRTGHAGFSFKCSDAEGGEAATLSRILYLPALNGNPTIVGIASSDKSVRLYSEYGSLIARDFGHTEGITDLAVVADGDACQLVTVAADSTIFIWDTRPATASPPASACLEKSAALPTLGPPLRKVISYSELSRFKQRQQGADVTESAPTPPPASPQRTLRKKSSRMSVAQAPRLDPAFTTTVATPSSRRVSMRQRSPPSPPSPRITGTTTTPRTKHEYLKRPSPKPRSKSTEDVHVSPLGGTSSASRFGTLAASTDSMVRTLRAYRKKLSTAPSESLGAEGARELEKELKLTVRVLSERGGRKKSVDEAAMARLLDQAGERIVGMLEERIKAGTVGVGGEGTGRLGSLSESADGDVIAGALEAVRLEDVD